MHTLAVQSAQKSVIHGCFQPRRYRWSTS
uniref:Uncharacterized protein n=1 Tax=Arundo donax TaxID=35708 RepID=A0A0A9EFJ6_ARUDO